MYIKVSVYAIELEVSTVEAADLVTLNPDNAEVVLLHVLLFPPPLVVQAAPGTGGALPPLGSIEA